MLACKTEGEHQVFFHEIVYAENPEESLRRVNIATGANFSMTYHSGHFAPRNETIHKFVGNMPWRILQNEIPSSYSFFYNHELKERVASLYKWDLHLYHYEFPYTLS